jgi:hypothetical protein
MNHLKFVFVLFIIFLLFQVDSLAQQKDSIPKTTSFSASLGITNNGISIIPTFALNAPATIMNFSWKKGRFSFDPDIRLATNFKKGSMLFWFRYYLVEGKKLTVRIGTHPAMNLMTRQVTENGTTTEISQARRFIANEVMTSYKIKPNWSVGVYYLQGNGFQADAPRLSQFVSLNTNISNIHLGKNIHFQLISAFYYLFLDRSEGYYFTATGVLTKKNFPLKLESTINQTFRSNIAGNQNFMWNVVLSYYFSRKQVRAN